MPTTCRQSTLQVRRPTQSRPPSTPLHPMVQLPSLDQTRHTRMVRRPRQSPPPSTPLHPMVQLPSLEQTRHTSVETRKARGIQHQWHPRPRPSLQPLMVRPRCHPRRGRQRQKRRPSPRPRDSWPRAAMQALRTRGGRPARSRRMLQRLCRTRTTSSEATATTPTRRTIPEWAWSPTTPTRQTTPPTSSTNPRQAVVLWQSSKRAS